MPPLTFLEIVRALLRALPRTPPPLLKAKERGVELREPPGVREERVGRGRA